MPIKGHLICAGSELLRGKINTHASTLARRLASLGIELAHEETVPDDLAALTGAIRRALDAAPLVIVTGGLGPTFDDLSREAAAAATGRALKKSPRLVRELAAKFRRAGYKIMPPMNARQADVLAGARVIANALGTAPGQWLEWAPGKILLLMPGPPRELHPMLEAFVLPALRRVFKARPRAEGHLHFVGIGESRVDAKIRPLLRKYAKKKNVRVDFTILAHLGLVDFDIFVEAERLARAQRTLAALVGEIERRLRRFCYGIDENYPLEKVVGDALRARRATLAVAESCTGGLLAAHLTNVAGSSDYFLGGIVAYTNLIKEEELGVPGPLLRRSGAVSAEVAAALAGGVRRKLGSTYGVGITGIAGPGGATRGKPVGLVFIGIATPRRVFVKEFNFSGTRDAVRVRAVTATLDILRQELLVKNKRFR